MPLADDKVKVEWLKKSGSLSQAYQSGLEFAMLSGDDRQATKFVYCKDYFQDALMGVHNGKAIGPIFGFAYDPAKDVPICLEGTKIAIGNSSDAKFSNKIPALAEFINAIEKDLRLVRTVISPIENPPDRYKKNGCFLLSGSARWQLSPPMLSMYTLLVRVGFCHKVGSTYQETIQGVVGSTIKPYQRDDQLLLKSAKPGIDTILKHGYAKIFYSDPKRNYPDVNVGVMHSSFGIVGFAGQRTRQYCKWWHRDLTKKRKPKEEPKKEEAASE
jgi:hypothetical protein